MRTQEHEKPGSMTTPATTPATTLDPTQQGARGQAAELLPDGGGADGIRRMFTWRGEVEVRPGVTETVYLGKYYWEHLPAGRLDAYERHAETPNGWFRITQTQYEIQHGAVTEGGRVRRRPNPDAWTTHLGRGDTVEVRTPIEFLNEHRPDPEGGSTFFLTSQTDCDVELALDGPLTADADVVIEALDEQGNQRTVATLHFPAGETLARGHYTLLPGEALRVRLLGAETTGMTLSGVTRVQLSDPGPFAPDTLDRYGTEEPQAVDLAAIVDRLR